jgi:hypothetical protein
MVRVSEPIGNVSGEAPYQARAPPRYRPPLFLLHCVLLN